MNRLPMTTLLCWILPLSMSPLLMVATAFATTTATRSIVKEISNYKNNNMRPQETKQQHTTELFYNKQLNRILLL